MAQVDYIKTLIDANKCAVANIKAIEPVVHGTKIETEKDKYNFGNMCILLKGFRLVAEATEALLQNDNVLIDENGDYYQKIDDAPGTTAAPENGQGDAGDEGK